MIKKITILVLVLLTSCSNPKNIEYPDCGISQDHLNNEISIIKIDEIYKIHRSIVVLVQNNSKYRISTTRNFDIKIFLYFKAKNEWRQINNSGIDFGEFEKTLTKRHLGFAPDISYGTKDAEVYICIYGKNEDTNEVVGASSLFKLITDK